MNSVIKENINKHPLTLGPGEESWKWKKWKSAKRTRKSAICVKKISNMEENINKEIKIW